MQKGSGLSGPKPATAIPNKHCSKSEWPNADYCRSTASSTCAFMSLGWGGEVGNEGAQACMVAATPEAQNMAVAGGAEGSTCPF